MPGSSRQPPRMQAMRMPGHTTVRLSQRQVLTDNGPRFLIENCPPAGAHEAREQVSGNRSMQPAVSVLRIGSI